MKNTVNFGDVEFKGKTLHLTDQAEPTSRLFDGSIHDAKDGEEYIDEWAAHATDDEGNDYKVIWHFVMVRGQEPEDGGDYPWEDKNIYAVTEL